MEKMAKYIEQDEIWPALNSACVPYNRATQKAIESIPAADVRPVVLCRDCKSYNRPRLGFCEMHLVRMHGDDFCSYGKKREES